MAKRLHGEGSIQQLKNGKWRCRVSDPNGKRISYTGATHREALTWLRNTTNQINQGLTYEAAKVTVEDYLERWLSGVKSSLRPSTFTGYQRTIRKYLIPALGTTAVKDLKADHIRYVYDGWLKDGAGVPTVRKAHQVLHRALESARETGLVYQNPADIVRAPKKAQGEMAFWTETEANQFLTTARGHRLYALFYLAVVTGARQMELLGLQWSDLSWTKGTLRICRQLVRSGRRGGKPGSLYADIKTRAGNRTIKVGEATLSVLRDHLQLQDFERKIAGERWQRTDDLIFTSTIGTPLDRKNVVERSFEPLIQAAGVKRIRFHDLRHTAVAIMLSNGKSVFSVSKYIGHARPSITSDIYGHLIPGAADDIGQMMDDLVNPTVVDLPKRLDHDWTQEDGQNPESIESGGNNEK